MKHPYRYLLIFFILASFLGGWLLIGNEGSDQSPRNTQESEDHDQDEGKWADDSSQADIPAGELNVVLEILDQEIAATHGFLIQETTQELLAAILREGTDFLVERHRAVSEADEIDLPETRESILLLIERAAIVSDDLYVAAGTQNRSALEEQVRLLTQIRIDLEQVAGKLGQASVSTGSPEAR